MLLYRLRARAITSATWTAFNDVIPPLIRIADEHDPVTRLARAGDLAEPELPDALATWFGPPAVA
jgi:hypothetical protein